jgi:hypothetical protein
MARKSVCIKRNVASIVAISGACATQGLLLEDVATRLSEMLFDAEHIAPVVAQTCEYCVTKLQAPQLLQQLLRNLLCARSTADYTQLTSGGAGFVASFLVEVATTCACSWTSGCSWVAALVRWQGAWHAGGFQGRLVAGTARHGPLRT